MLKIRKEKLAFLTGLFAAVLCLTVCAFAADTPTTHCELNEAGDTLTITCDAGVTSLSKNSAWSDYSDTIQTLWIKGESVETIKTGALSDFNQSSTLKCVVLELPLLNTIGSSSNCKTASTVFYIHDADDTYTALVNRIGASGDATRRIRLDSINELCKVSVGEVEHGGLVTNAAPYEKSGTEVLVSYLPTDTYSSLSSPISGGEGDGSRRVIREDTVFTATTKAGSGNVDDFGFSGDTVKWFLLSDGTLRFTGIGDISAKGSAGNYDWYENRNLTSSIVIDDGITSIPAYAFQKTGAISVVIGNNVESIGDNAFYNASILSEVIFGERVEIIGKYAFTGVSIEDLTLGDSVVSIGDYAFSNNSLLKTAVLGDGLTAISTGAFANDTSLTNITLGTQVETIGSLAFSGTGLLELELDDSVTTIGSSAFSSSALQRIDLGNGVTTIGSSAFNNCGNLEEVVFGTELTEIGTSAFNKTALKAIKLGDKVASIGNSAFANIPTLQEVTLGEGLCSIGNSAFSKDSALKEITFGVNLETLGNSVFSDCTSMHQVNFTGPKPDSENLGDSLFPYDRAGEFLITYLSRWALSWSKGLTDASGTSYPCMVAGDSVSEFSTLTQGEDGFYRNEQGIIFTLMVNHEAMVGTDDASDTATNNCGYWGKNSGTVIIPDTVTYDGQSYDVTVIGTNAFSNNFFLKSVHLGKNVG
ncbi:MAG: leucine-rich repeat domain-containing protein, partial [Oscillospiraceae bacterium]|nr:leucine-rich repeat domain-containing protein [Oscillospiraceae bacterium]